MLASGPPSPRVPANWAELPDEQLLDLRLSDLPLGLDGTVVEGRIAQLQGELAARELQLPINFYISNEWFTPDGTVAYRALDLSGYARIDLRMDASGKAYVIEANPNPQLAALEDFAQSAKLAKLPYPKLLERIMALGLQWQPHRLALE